ncbi:MAG TPA: ASCH domain-containing protein [Thermomicrobiales bacterium]
MAEPAAIETCWSTYLRSLPAGTPVPSGYFEASAFGAEGESELADELAGLVERGIKTATSSLLRYYQEGNHPIERVGDRCIVLASTGQPRCIIEMTEVRIVPFGEVDAAFAVDYGEGERTLAWWREHLGDYYAKHSAAAGWPFGEETPLVCKRFRVVFRCPEA